MLFFAAESDTFRLILRPFLGLFMVATPLFVFCCWPLVYIRIDFLPEVDSREAADIELITRGGNLFGLIICCIWVFGITSRAGHGGGRLMVKLHGTSRQATRAGRQIQTDGFLLLTSRSVTRVFNVISGVEFICQVVGGIV